MKDIKKSIKIAGILFLVLSLVEILALGFIVYVIKSDLTTISYTWLDYIFSSIEIVLSLISGIVYLSFKNKSPEEILKHKKTFLILAIVNVFNSFIGWVISFWIELVIQQNYRFSPDFNGDINNNFDTQARNNPDEIVIDESEYKVIKTETLTSKLEELDKLRNRNLISEDEYVKLRQEAIDKFLG